MNALNKDRYLNSTCLLYFCFFIMLLMMVFMKDAHFEAPEVGAITQILHPEYPKGRLQYNPSFNYDYIVAFVAAKLGYKNNFTQLAPLFWFIDMAVAVLVLIKLCNFIFKNNKLVLTIAVMMFMLLKSGEIDQKTMLMPLYFAGVYYFLRERWYISAFFGAAIFYLHIGFAIWWFLPSCFALCLISMAQKRVSLKQILGYMVTVILLALPILYFYLSGVRSINPDNFFIKYYYFACWKTTSVLLNLLNHVSLISPMLTVAILIVGYSKAKKAGCRIDYITAISMGVLILYIIAFIFADMIGNGTARTLQLIRSMVNIELFSSLFLAFLLAKQIRSGNYIFLLLFIITSRYYYSGLSRLIGNIPYYSALNILYFITLMYEIFEGHISRSISRIYHAFNIKANTGHAGEITGKSKAWLQSPILIAIVFIVLTGPKSIIKSFLHIQRQNSALEWPRSRYLLDDIAKFTNDNITDKDAVLLTPFLETDFEFYTMHNIFLNYDTPVLTTVSLHRNSIPALQNILKNDLNFSFEEVLKVKKFNLEKFRNDWDLKWRDLSETTIRKWNKEYHLTHVIREKEMPLDFPILYQNKFYIIYEIK